MWMGEIIVSVFGEDGGLAVYEKDSIKIVNSDFSFKDDAAYDFV